jgi:hypothetical protein
VILFVLSILSQVDAQIPPRGLSCLPQWYAGTVVNAADAGWGLQLENGIFIPWDNQSTRTSLEPESDAPSIPDIKSIYNPGYTSGIIVPIDIPDGGLKPDSGRSRVEPLLKATYGETEGQVNRQMGRVKFFGLRWPFHERAELPLQKVVERLEALVKGDAKFLKFVKPIGGTFTWRKIKRTQALSSHSFGIAIDLNTEYSHYWRWKRRGEPWVWRNKIPQEIVDAFESEGFIWGGRWQHFDTMHFEYRPELLSPDCREVP